MVKKGEVYYADMEPVIGSEQKGYRPVVIIQNDILNEYSPTTIVATVTSRTKKYLNSHVKVYEKDSGLYYGATVLLEQVRTIDKQRLGEKLGQISKKTMKRLDQAALFSLGINKT